MSTYLADAAEDRSVTGPSAVFTYRQLGPHGGVPLVLLHRFRGTIDWWDAEFLDYLAADHDVIVFDNVGIGYSTTLPVAGSSAPRICSPKLAYHARPPESTITSCGWRVRCGRSYSV